MYMLFLQVLGLIVHDYLLRRYLIGPPGVLPARSMGMEAFLQCLELSDTYIGPF
jgi:hypothetical protein